MVLKSRPRSILLVCIGLFGMSLYWLVLRVAHPAILSNDFVRGVWYGLCLGLEILGVYRLGKESRTRED
jgi:hypothetical protein